jgi:ABC-2 type transport system ATP-binding protein
MLGNAICVSGLTKVYSGRRRTQPVEALKAIDLVIPRGSLFGLLAPNGAGKSTLINILAGLVRKTAGYAEVWGFDVDRYPKQARSSIGVVPQELNLDPFFTPRELLDLQAGLYGVPKRKRITAELLELVGLSDKANAYARTLSGGMRRRLMVAKAMVHSPPVLILDEPTAGVDVELRRHLWTQVRAMNRAGTTVLLTTHYIEEAEELCDRIAIIRQGTVVACDTTFNLLQRLDSKTLIVNLESPLTAVPAALTEWQAELLAPNRLQFHYRPSEAKVGEIMNALLNCGIRMADLTTDETGLEELFLQLTRSE